MSLSPCGDVQFPQGSPRGSGRAPEAHPVSTRTAVLDTPASHCLGLPQGHVLGSAALCSRRGCLTPALSQERRGGSFLRTLGPAVLGLTVGGRPTCGGPGPRGAQSSPSHGLAVALRSPGRGRQDNVLLSPQVSGLGRSAHSHPPCPHHAVRRRLVGSSLRVPQRRVKAEVGTLTEMLCMKGGAVPQARRADTPAAHTPGVQRWASVPEETLLPSRADPPRASLGLCGQNNRREAEREQRVWDRTAHWK